ncbi:hypothetical protein HNR76_001326 [Pseudoxanthomonas broegbernensis]|nr:hypothetical protein [Pseudoxanthomonas broegbernensis]
MSASHFQLPGHARAARVRTQPLDSRGDVAFMKGVAA